MTRASVVFGNKVFATKTAAKAYVLEEIIKPIGVCPEIKQKYPEKYKELCALLRRHHNAGNKLKNMSDLSIRRNLLNDKALEVHVVKSENGRVSTEDISWLSCIDKWNPNHDLKSAMRFSIESQCAAYKLSLGRDGLLCTLCSIPDQPIHVDHVVQFEQLFQEFIAATLSEIPDQFSDVDDGTNRKTFLYKDAEFKQEWTDYHKTHAILRILCKQCNLTRPKYIHK